MNIDYIPDISIKMLFSLSWDSWLQCVLLFPAVMVWLSYGLLILYCTRKNLPQYHNLLRALKEDFHFICTDGEKYRYVFRTSVPL